MLEARRSEVSARARARAYTQHVRPRKVHVVASLLSSYTQGLVCVCVCVCTWGWRVRTERGRPLFRALLGIFGGTRTVACVQRGNEVDIAAFVWLARGSSPPPFLPPPLSLFDEATASSTQHLLLLLNHPQPFSLLFPSPPFLTTGLPACPPCLSPPPPQVLPTHHPRRILHARVTRDFVRSPLTKGGIFVRAAEEEG